MAVDVRRVTERRKVHFSNVDELLADAERLVKLEGEGKVQPLGNMSLGQALGHLALWMHASIDGIPMDAPPLLKLGARMFKKSILSKPIPAGFKLPPDAEAKLVPSAAMTATDGFNKLSAAVARLLRDHRREPSPMLGTLTVDEWDQLHLRHAELHLGFMRVVE
jgi:hypothetical protein